jgi:hypothetical protein
MRASRDVGRQVSAGARSLRASTRSTRKTFTLRFQNTTQVHPLQFEKLRFEKPVRPLGLLSYIAALSHRVCVCVCVLKCTNVSEALSASIFTERIFHHLTL